ncbi:hypothetical protein GW17_00032774, partial [Ensete ventricosum]
ELIEELGINIVGYDRAGYGESDPNPSRSLRSEASDIAELADALELGPRIAGAAIMAPVINYRWPGFPRHLSEEAYRKQQPGDQWALRVAYYAPWLLHWWMKQSWLPSSTVIKGTTHLPNRLDAQLREYAMKNGGMLEEVGATQCMHESFYRDMMVMFGKWEFDPMDLSQPPFPVHLWHGDEDGYVPVTLQRYICSRLSWIDYHELKETGHYLGAMQSLVDVVLKTMLVSSVSA